MMCNYEIWVDEPIETSLKNVIQKAFFKQKHFLWCIEIEGKKFLVVFDVNSSTKIENGIHFVKIAISNVLFTEIKETKELVVYDHFKGFLRLINPGELEKEHIYETTILIPILSYTDRVIQQVAQKIAEFLRNKK